MAVALQPSMQQEAQIDRLTQLLQHPELSDDVRAKVYYERGNYYDSLGLRDLARRDFNQSLHINPKQPDIYNLIGVYFTQIGKFDAAYDAFDSALELDPDNGYALRNRAIALYYGDRPRLAMDDMLKQYQQNPQDPFSALWLYIIQSDINPQQARHELLSRYAKRDNQWGWVLVAITLNEISDEQAFNIILEDTHDNQLLAQRLTETYFYMAKRYQSKGDYANAIALYKLALSFNVYEYVEHRYSFVELNRIFTQLQIKKEQEQKAAQDAAEKSL